MVLAIVVALSFAVPAALRFELALFSASLVPVFAAGLAEDFGYEIKSRTRLMAAVISSLTAVALLQMWVPRVDIPVLDDLIAIAPVGIVFTAFATAGISNAFNLIDGVNGLSAITGAIVAIGLSSIADRAGEPLLAQSFLFILPAIFGFLIFNFPYGKIFLGDAGAYTLGHVLSWFAIMLMVRAEAVTPWAVVLVFFWPISDTLFAIYRRKISGKRTDQPDRLHFHQLVMRAIEICGAGRRYRFVSNPLTTLILVPFITAPVVAGVALWDRPKMAALAVVVFAAMLTISYLLGMSLAKRRPKALKRFLLRAGIVPDNIAPDLTRIEDEPEVSELSGIFMEDNLAVDVRIYRLPSMLGWVLETRDGVTTPVRWSKRFSSDLAAWNEFLRVVKEESMESVGGPMKTTNR